MRPIFSAVAARIAGIVADHAAAVEGQAQAERVGIRDQGDGSRGRSHSPRRWKGRSERAGRGLGTGFGRYSRRHGNAKYNSRTMRAVESLVQRVARTIEERGLFRRCRRAGGGGIRRRGFGLPAARAAGTGAAMGLGITRIAPGPLPAGRGIRGDADFVGAGRAGWHWPASCEVASASSPGQPGAGRRKARLEFFARSDPERRSGPGGDGAYAVGPGGDGAVPLSARRPGQPGWRESAARADPGSCGRCSTWIAAKWRCFLRERGIGWREDSTNASLMFARNRLRHELLPQLRGTGIRRSLATLAQDGGVGGARKSLLGGRDGAAVGRKSAGEGWGGPRAD